MSMTTAEVSMKRKLVLIIIVLMFSLLLGSCSELLGGISSNQGLEGTQVALAIQQTSLAMNQTLAAQPREIATQGPVVIQEQAIQPTYTPYPTYTVQALEPPAVEPPAVEPPEMDPPSEELLSTDSFEEWMTGANILVYDAMWGRDTPVIENAIEALGLGRNTINVRDAVGDFLSNMNSATKWDLVIVGSEWRSLVQGEVFDVIVSQLDRGSSIVFETWYIDQVYNGRVAPILSRCGIEFHKDWLRSEWNYNANDYLVYLLEPDDPVLYQPNPISMLIPYDIRWVDDVGDTVELVAGSDATLLAGRLPKEFNSYGLMVKCMDGRLIWQTFSTHDYKDQEMTNLWANYIYNALLARYEYIQ